MLQGICRKDAFGRAEFGTHFTRRCPTRSQYILAVISHGGGFGWRLLCADLFFLFAADSSIFSSREAGGRYRGSGAGSPVVIVILTVGLMAFFLIPQSFRDWRNYRALREEEKRQEVNHDDRGA